MNNANCELRGLPEQPVTRQHGTQARTATLNPNDEAMRDFFRRGDRGQYEGGPADHSLHSLLKVEVPERAPIVRTPQQQARRLALIRFEAVLLAGCVGFLVAAARSNSSGTSELQGASAARDPALQKAQTIARPSAVNPGPLKARALIAAPASATVTVSKAMPVVQVQAPKLAKAPQTTVAKSSIRAADAGTVAQVRSATPNATLPSVKRQRQASVAAPAFKSEPTAPTRSVAPRVAVGAFPDD